MLAGAGCRVDAWETTYLHILAGANPVVEWVKGTALRPVLSVLDQAQTAEFLAEYADRMARAYPPRPFGTVLPFRRVFVVAQRPTDREAKLTTRTRPATSLPHRMPSLAENWVKSGRYLTGLLSRLNSQRLYLLSKLI